MTIGKLKKHILVILYITTQHQKQQIFYINILLTLSQLFESDLLHGFQNTKLTFDVSSCVSCSAETLGMCAEVDFSCGGVIFEDLKDLDFLGARGVSTLSSPPAVSAGTIVGGEAGLVKSRCLVKTPELPHLRELDT